MTSQNRLGGGIVSEVSGGGGIPVDIRAALQAEIDGGELLTFGGVEKRLGEAWECWQRMPDREASWQHVKALWPDIQRQPWRVAVGGEHDEWEAAPETKRPNLTRDQIAATIEASEWLKMAPEEDRRLIGLVIEGKVRFGKRFRWTKLWKRYGDRQSTKDGLRMRYNRAITAIAKALSR